MLVEKGLVSLTIQQLSSDDSFQCIVHPKMVRWETNRYDGGMVARSQWRKLFEI